MRVQWDYNGLPGTFEGTVGIDASVTCQGCGQTITQDRPGIAVWKATDGLPATVDVEFLHKVTCDNDQSKASEELGTLLGRILGALGYSGTLIPPGMQPEEQE